MSSNPAAERQFSRVMASHGAARFEGLVKLARVHTDYAPVWSALAEEHWRSRRREEALQAARRAIKLDPNTHRGFSSELKMASRSILAQIAPAAARPQKPKQPARSAPVSSSGIRVTRMLESALALRDRNERISLLEELHAIAPDEPEVLFHLAKELAVVGRAEDARRVGEELRAIDPDAYTKLYAWASQHLVEAQAEARRDHSSASASASAPASVPASAPATPQTASAGAERLDARREVGVPRPGAGRPAHTMPALDTPNPALDGRRRGPPASYSAPPMPPTRSAVASSDQATARIPSSRSTLPIEGPYGQSRRGGPAHAAMDDDFDGAVTMEKSLDPLLMPDDEEVTNRSSIDEISRVAPPKDENATRRLNIVELERLASASMDPNLDD